MSRDLFERTGTELLLSAGQVATNEADQRTDREQSDAQQSGHDNSSLSWCSIISNQALCNKLSILSIILDKHFESYNLSQYFALLRIIFDIFY